MRAPKHVLLSRTDSIGDVVLTLPMAKALKDAFPEVRISFLGKAYTRPVIEACIYIDQFVDEGDFLRQQETDVDVFIHVFPKPALARHAKTLGIPLRIGTTNRLYHWWTCNKLVRLSRKNSDLHEAQLNMKLLEPLGLSTGYQLDELSGMMGLRASSDLPSWAAAIFAPGKRVVILHPKSQGSAREWPLDHFKALAALLLQEGYVVAFSGTEREQEALRPLLAALNDRVVDLTGRLSLTQFMAFISQADGLVAASTGPLHIAGALGKAAVGIYPAQRPMHAGRWGVLGKHAVSLTGGRSKTAPESLGDVTTADVREVLKRALEGVPLSGLPKP